MTCWGFKGELEEEEESSLSYNSPSAARGATGGVTDRLDEVFHEEEDDPEPPPRKDKTTEIASSHTLMSST